MQLNGGEKYGSFVYYCGSSWIPIGSVPFEEVLGFKGEANRKRD